MEDNNKSVEQVEPIVELEFESSRITILGTAHISRASADKVQEMIATGIYDAVAVELCPSRFNSIVNPDALAKMDLFKVIKNGQASMVAASLALGAYQQRMAEQFKIEPGAEMRVAIKDAEAAKLPVLLIDREIGTTLKRIYRNIPWWKRINLFAGLFASIVSHEKVTEEEIEQLKQGDMLESTFAQFAQQEKDLFKPLIDERDEYMSAQLQKQIADNNYKHILAVVGAGHMHGMKNYIDNKKIQQPELRIQTLDTIPEGSRWLKLIPWTIVAVILIGFGLGFSQGSDIGIEMIEDWFLITGALAAVGGVLAMAHPLTIIAAFLSAPITTLNPAIGVGMITAPLETYLRRPKVSDFSQLRRDATSMKGWWKNPVTRILLVFILTSLGASIGTYVAGFTIFSKLSGG